MANKRNLKKQVKYVCGDIATDCLIAGNYVKGVDPAVMRELVGKLAGLQDLTLKNISFAFDKAPRDFETRNEYNKARAAYFKKAYTSLREKFNARIQEIIKEMNAALPQEVKDANKAEANK
ncbi:MAG: hypothetical protein K2K36_03550 [Muribaculaceae bacterium]|nr:hypothetical protein [Muribaculaceae bacterium]